VSGWLDPLRRALDARAQASVPVFFRDDDAGWGDAELMLLLDRVAAAGVPIDVAAIPAQTGPALAAELCSRREAGVRVHQHGLAHVDHQSQGRKCEFGADRTAAQRQADIVTGQQLLRDLFGADLEPVFTPPWNRSVIQIGDALVAADIAVLSRDRSAGTIEHPAIIEVPVDVDWFGSAKQRAADGTVTRRRWTPAELAERLAAAVEGSGRLGVMLHHAVTDADDLRRIGELADLVAAHPAATATTICAVAGLGLDAP
jgi:hypothetical protein